MGYCDKDLKTVLNAHAEWLNGVGGQRADLRDADLRGTNLRDANLRGADLRDANLWGTNLRDADLRGANLWGAIDAPIQMQVGPWLVYIQSGYMRIGCECHSIENWRSFNDERIWEMEKNKALEFWHVHRDWLLAACDAQAQTRKESD